MPANKKPIPLKTAIKLCKEVREENKNKIFSISKWQCWGCVKASKEDPKKMCFYGKDNRGCTWVNKKFDSANR